MSTNDKTDFTPLRDDEMAAVSGGRCPITNGDDPRFQLTMQVMQYTYRQATYFGNGTCP
ncbi:hypothetical protein [uncultured Bradyrhizobium sp.]|jgi:hypothetical protein|uniref:hypothetical protein n=1 Tax=uncultured Bradyrhizobium sp. TaxID=199684 RepID=UPI00262D93C9|nr:hypothetical protein [uncultured Bradyrhizobium sp.]